MHMDKQERVEKIFREYLDRLERGEALDLKAYFSQHDDIEDALWERFWTWEEARSVFKEDPEPDEDDAIASVAQNPELFFAFRDDRGEEFGRRIGDFTLLKEIGRGTMGVVFLARQEVTDRLVALKLLSPLRHKSPTARERFRREVSALGRLNHQHIVSILTAGDVEGIPYFAMELVCGVQMDELLTSFKGKDPTAITGQMVKDFLEENIPEYMKPFVEETTAPVSSPNVRKPEPEVFTHPYVAVACRFVIHLAEALDHAHSQGVLHRDVKPSNVLIDIHGRCRLSDFGLARELGTAALTKTGELVGTPFYAAPEQLAGKRVALSNRADIFSLGVTLYELLCLTVPFQGETPQQVFNQILVKNPRPPGVHNPGVPKELETIVFKCLEKDPDHRYPNARALAEDLRAFLEFRPIKAQPIGPFRSMIKLIRRHRMVAAALSVAFIAVLILAGYMAKVQWAEFENQRDLERQVEEVIGFTRSALDAHALEDAETHFGRLLSLDDAHPEVDSLRKAIAMLSCDRELEHARRLREEYRTLSTEWTGLDRELATLQRKIESSFTTGKERIKAQELRQRLKRLELQLADSKENIIYALNTARAQSEAAGEYECPSVFTAFAAHYMDRWEEELDVSNTFGMDHYATLVRKYDTKGKYTATLEGLAKLTISGTEGARVYLFRYDSHVKVSPNAGVDRLVPVPGLGEVKDEPVPVARGFYAGDPCIVVRNGGITNLKPGDLVVAIDGQRAADGLFVESVAPGSPAARKNVEPFQRISAVNGLDQLSAFSWDHYRSDAPAWIVVTSQDRKISVLANGPGDSLTNRSGIRVLSGERLLSETPAPRTIKILAVRNGIEVEAVIKEGDVASIRGDVTAYALHCTEQNLLGTLPLSSMECAPGSCLVLVRKAGMEDLRLPVVLDRKKPIHLQAELLAEGTSPPGFVRVASGYFYSGGDREALWPEDRIRREVKEFWIARRETTLGEWFDFAADRYTAGAVDRPGAYLPRLTPPSRETGSGEKETKFLVTYDDEKKALLCEHWRDLETPVVGVSRQDVIDFLEWKNQGAGGEWVYALPTQAEWEKAARGVDERFFPWGNRFDFTFCKTFYSHTEEVSVSDDLKLLEPGLSFPIDESPHGVRDLAGSVIEWNADRTSPEYPIYSIRGGAYDGARASLFRLASRDSVKSDSTAHNLGFRLVARRR